MSNTDRWVRPHWWTNEARLLRRLRLTVIAHPGGFTIRPAKEAKGFEGRARLTFTDSDRGPHIGEIRNDLDVGGWGRPMVTVLHAIYPDASTWGSTQIRDSGVAFWAKMQREFDVQLVDNAGNPRLPEEFVPELLADIAAKEQGIGSSTRPRRTSHPTKRDRPLS